MANATPPPLTPHDASIIAIHASLAFTDLIESLPSEQQRGAVLLFERLVAAAEPLLPRTPEMAHVFVTMTRVRELAESIRGLTALSHIMHGVQFIGRPVDDVVKLVSGQWNYTKDHRHLAVWIDPTVHLFTFAVDRLITTYEPISLAMWNVLYGRPGEDLDADETETE